MDYPPVSLAHPFDDGSAVMDRSLDASAETSEATPGLIVALIAPLLADWDKILPEILGPLPLLPRHPLALARFGWYAIRSGRGLAESTFKGEHARTAFAGLAGHSIMPLESPATASYGLVFSLSIHGNGWPLPQGGAHTITQAMAAYLQSLGGEIITSHTVTSLAELPAARAFFLDVSPRSFINILGEKKPAGYRKQPARFRYGPGVCKVDAPGWPIPGKTHNALRQA
jgi:phytoene dehydrogenase-like protein